MVGKALTAALLLLVSSGSAVAAWTETILHSFSNSGAAIANGFRPHGGLIKDGAGRFYGTTLNGGSGAGGTVFQLSPLTGGQWKLTVLYSFSNSGPAATNGYTPHGSLVKVGNDTLYGVTMNGGNGAGGTVFKLTRMPGNQWTLTTLRHFANSGAGLTNGDNPTHGLIRDADGNLYGTAAEGGDGDGGVIFRINSAGNFSVLHRFEGSGPGSLDGFRPWGGLIRDAAGNLYGTTAFGGNGGLAGVLFRLRPDGTYTVLHRFGKTGGDLANGYSPAGRLVRDSNGNLYGVNEKGGSGAGGTVYRRAPNGTITVLQNFANSGPGLARGYTPRSGLTRTTDGTLYGTTTEGGSGGGGTAFRIMPGGAFELLRSFFNSGPALARGYTPSSGLLLDPGGSVFGTTDSGGNGAGGVVYRLSP